MIKAIIALGWAGSLAIAWAFLFAALPPTPPSEPGSPAAQLARQGAAYARDHAAALRQGLAVAVGANVLQPGHAPGQSSHPTSAQLAAMGYAPADAPAGRARILLEQSCGEDGSCEERWTAMAAVGQGSAAEMIAPPGSESFWSHLSGPFPLFTP